MILGWGLFVGLAAESKLLMYTCTHTTSVYLQHIHLRTENDAIVPNLTQFAVGAGVIFVGVLWQVDKIYRLYDRYYGS